MLVWQSFYSAAFGFDTSKERNKSKSLAQLKDLLQLLKLNVFLKDSEITFKKRKRPAKRLDDDENTGENSSGESNVIQGVQKLSQEEETEEYCFATTAQGPETTQENSGKEETKPASIASSQGFQRITSQAKRNNPRTSSSNGNGSDERAKKTNSTTSEVGGREEVAMEEEDADIIPPSEPEKTKEKKSVRLSLSGKISGPEQGEYKERAATAESTEEGDVYEFTMSQSQRERDGLEEFKKGLEAKQHGAEVSLLCCIFCSQLFVAY